MDHDPLDLKSQEKAKADSALQNRLTAETEEADVKWLMSSKRGRRIVWRLLEQAGVFRSTFNPTAMQMAFNEGYRNFGNRMLGLVHQNCSELYPQMLKEQAHGKPDADRANQ
jgi:hypothetical protein